MLVGISIRIQKKTRHQIGNGIHVISLFSSIHHQDANCFRMIFNAAPTLNQPHPHFLPTKGGRLDQSFENSFRMMFKAAPSTNHCICCSLYVWFTLMLSEVRSAWFKTRVSGLPGANITCKPRINPNLMIRNSGCDFYSNTYTFIVYLLIITFFVCVNRPC